MQTKLKLSHDEMVVLAAIADQELRRGQLEDELYAQGMSDFTSGLNSLLDRKFVTRRTEWGFTYYYAIAPEILSLNHPPYSYESWRDLSE